MRINGPNEIVEFQFIFSGMMLIVYMGNPVAMIDEDGAIIMRDEKYEVWFIEYLITEMSMHMYWLN